MPLNKPTLAEKHVAESRHRASERRHAKWLLTDDGKRHVAICEEFSAWCRRQLAELKSREPSR